MHPSEIHELDEARFAWLKGQAANPNVVAIGEIGLDYYWEKDPAVQKAQRDWFARQMQLARQMGLPAVIHSRDAAEDTMQVMKEVCAWEIPGVVHCYSYSPELAKEFVKMGYYIGVGGVVTFKNSRKLKETVKQIHQLGIYCLKRMHHIWPLSRTGERGTIRDTWGLWQRKLRG